MKNYFSAKQFISSDLVDHNQNMRADGILSVFQNLTTFHSAEMNVDFDTLRKTSNAFWVLTKIKYKVLNYPKFNSEVLCKTFPTLGTSYRFYRNYEITDLNGNNLVLGSSEWCVLDLNTKLPRKATTISFPTDMKFLDGNNGLAPFVKQLPETSKQNYVYTRVIRSTDIDLNLHTNNVMYAKFTLDAFSISELNKINLKEFELHFISQSFENDKIDIYKIQFNNGYFVEGKKEDKRIFVAFIN